MINYGESYLVGVIPGTPTKFRRRKDVSFSDDLNDAPDYIKRINFPMSDSAEFMMEADIDASVFNKLCGVDLGHGPDFTATASFQVPHLVQARRHKKRRINKKWAKRYGYIAKFRTVNIENISVNRNEDDIIGFTADKISYDIH